MNEEVSTRGMKDHNRLQMKDEIIKYVNETYRIEYDDRGRPERMIGILQNIAKLKRAEDSLKKLFEK